MKVETLVSKLLENSKWLASQPGNINPQQIKALRNGKVNPTDARRMPLIYLVGQLTPKLDGWIGCALRLILYGKNSEGMKRL